MFRWLQRLLPGKNREPGLEARLGPYRVDTSYYQDRKRGDDAPNPSLERAMWALLIEEMEPEKWTAFIADLPRILGSHPALANEEWITLLLEGVGQRTIHGQNDKAERLCAVAEVTWEHLGSPQLIAALNLADWWIRFEQPQRAEAIYQRLIAAAEQPDAPMPVPDLAPYLGWLLLAEKKPGAALEHLEISWPSDRSKPESVPEGRQQESRARRAVVLTMASFEVGDMKRAEEYLQYIAMHEPLGVVATSIAQFIGAPNARAGGELTARGYLSVAEAFFSLGWWQQAMLCYNRALEANPNLVEAHRHRGDAFFAQGMTLKAVECYQVALAIDPKDAPSHRYLGEAYVRLGKLDEAIQSTERAVESDQSYVQAVSQLEMLRQLKKAGGLSADPLEWPV